MAGISGLILLTKTCLGPVQAGILGVAGLVVTALLGHCPLVLSARPIAKTISWFLSVFMMVPLGDET